MSRSIDLFAIACLLALLALSSCVPSLKVREVRKSEPATYAGSTDTTNAATKSWQRFFTDPDLRALIDSALANNQELNIMLQEIAIAQSEVRARKGEYLPFVDIGAAAGVEKVGEFTRNGAVEHNLQIAEDTKFPEPLPDFIVGARASWEVDIWKKLRNARKAAMMRYLGSVEGKNFMVTHLVAEIANAYYELMALDNQLEILRSNIAIQQDALAIVKLEKQAAKVTELAVRRFEAEVLKNRSVQYDIQQRIVETENRINFLVGRYPRPVRRNSAAFSTLVPDTIYAGLPSQLLNYRPDIRQAERELVAAKLDVRSARASFYPQLRLTAGVGLNAFAPSKLIQAPQSLLYSVAGDLVAPLINRNAIKAAYQSANARQLQAVYDYERTVLNAYVEVVNQLSNIQNLRSSYELRAQQVEALSSSITISTNLFRSARADYMEVLLTQRDALESRFELVETRMQQMNAMVNVYQALGGGWR
ncbi:MAG: efflux transporter outer membrane subunit [Flavobacteriales bacterium]|nr:efflux transporter outer membrane subunit [Flavobacteriales bacterium]MBK9538325.1 efflux transporter outer membrane subunit [Flavobacteriales bacterium]